MRYSLEHLMMKKPPKGRSCHGCRRYGEVCSLPCYRDVKLSSQNTRQIIPLSNRQRYIE